MKNLALVLFIAGLALPSVGIAHCEIPCGIYDDAARLDSIAEHIATIEKSMKQIVSLSGVQKPNYNQLVRWVSNKDEHAERLQEIVWQYFMTQRIKPADPADAEGRAATVHKLTLLHEMLVAAMKCKQTTDLEHVEKLRSLLAEFRKAYGA